MSAVDSRSEKATFEEDREEGEGIDELEDDTFDDWCYECRGYGDDYYFDDEGELQCCCDDCPANHYLNRD